MVRKDDVMQFAFAGLFSGAMVFGLYRVEVTLAGESGLSTLNVSLAAGTLFLLGTVLLLGPLSRLFAVFDWGLKFRKELGIITFITGLLHVYLTMFPLARNGPWGLYRSRPFSAYPGLEALIVLFILFLFSWNWATHVLGAKLWWQIQYWGARIAFVLIGTHMIVLKYKTILSSIVPGSEPVTPGIHTPPLIVWEAQFLLLVLVIRLSELFGPKAARIITQVSTALVLSVLLWTTFAG